METAPRFETVWRRPTAIKENTLIWCTSPKVHVPPWSGHERRPIPLRLSDIRKHPIPVKHLVLQIQKQDREGIFLSYSLLQMVKYLPGLFHSYD